MDATPMETDQTELNLKPTESSENSSTATTPKKPPEVVVLEDDEEVIDLVKKPKKTENTECINYACRSGKNMIKAPIFCLTYYRVKGSGKKVKEVCEECFDEAVRHYEDLSGIAERGGDLFGFNFKLRNDLVDLDDSDEGEAEVEEEEGFDQDAIKFLEENLEEALGMTMKKYDLPGQVENGMKFLQEKRVKVAESFAEVDKNVKELRKRLDRVQFDLYDEFKAKYKELRPIEIYTDNNLPALHKPKQLDRRTQRVKQQPMAIQTTPPKDVPVYELPPLGPIVKPPLVIGEEYYCSRNMTRGSWVRVRLLEVIAAGKQYMDNRVATEVMYRIQIESNAQTRFVSGRELAYSKPSRTRLEVGTRVIASYFNSTESKRRETLYPGIVGEPTLPSNRNRYMIFFDDGYIQYVPHSYVFMVVSVSKDVWDDIYYENRDFIKKYLQAYPDRSMVKLNKGQTVSTEHKGVWWISTVVDVDCSLVKVRFEQLQREEWVYRGSSRLSPIYKEQLAASSRMQNKARTPRMVTNSTSLKSEGSVPYVQYSRNDDDVQIVPTPQPNKPEAGKEAPRAVARKSTAKPVTNTSQSVTAVPFLPFPAENRGPDRQPPSKIVYYTPREQSNPHSITKSHRCTPKCKDYATYNLAKLSGYNPLSKPLLCGWYRDVVKRKGKREVIYKAPCGRFLRNMDEINRYLMATQSDMTVDLFDFDLWVRCLAEFVLDSDQVITKDLSNGEEQVPIPVVNYEDDEVLNFSKYSTKREPMEGVHLNLDPEFLCGCDCTDNCQDKLKCACWRLTLDGAKRVHKNIDPQYIGYTHRRLLDQVITGIYECNSRCKCNSTCLNRVVQNPLQMKLQVFKTRNRGWGIRCLNDIPQGAFICIYAGSLLTEQMANEGGKTEGDEYLAELDYIETAEKTKEDYEEEVVEPEASARRSRTPEEEEEEEEVREPVDGGRMRKRYTEDADFVYTARVPKENQSIKSRLRPRNTQDDKQDDAQTEEKEQNRKPEPEERKNLQSGVTTDEAVTISDDENDEREISNFNPSGDLDDDSRISKYRSVREMFGHEEAVYIMDAKNSGNIGRFLNHSCSPNVFVQNVFVDTHDVRFPWVAFFSLQYIRAGTELTWNYNYDIGSVPGKVLYCHCSSSECKGRLL